MRMTSAEVSAHKARVPAPVRKFKLTRPEPLEAAIQHAILRALKVHPAVAWHQRINTGATVVGEGKARRYVRYGFQGCSDVIGQLKDGRFLAIEVKRPSGRVTDDQAAFIETVVKNGGVAFVARSVTDVWQVLDGVK